MKHKKADCVFFLEGGPPCEDCDLEGHSALCGWQRDWHSCDCGAFDSKQSETFAVKVLDVVEQQDGSALVSFDLGEDFVAWFCKHKNLQDFDKNVFQEWFIEAVKSCIESNSTKSRQEDFDT